MPGKVLRAAAALLVAALCSCAPERREPAAGVALVIGINAYEGNWPALSSARPDAEAVARVLEERYGFEVRRLFDAAATRAAILGALDQLCLLDDRATVILFYAGHGVLDEDGEGYWIPFGAVRKEAGIAHADLADRLLVAAPRRVLVISDACFSGSLLGRRLWDGTGNAPDDGRPAKYVIASGDLAPVPDAQGAHSVFAQALLEALTNPPGGALSVADLVHALQRRLQRLTGQVVRAGPLAPETDGAFVLRGKPGR
ncbi:MAG TPA: caspase family protein [Kiritimatiellia bacterium]|nr:caspase family protein [Kiritimatiellia bacterium]HRZ12793.1 caspase family protein [Kiritimatiellia bacterium]HSA18255.1 caspase family protein [Kiritimatiellia bacterium]